MKGNCVDIGIIQAFLDGEVSPERSVAVSAHISDCEDCSLLLVQAEEENALVFSVLDGEMNAMVPTQRLWASINESLEKENVRRPFFAGLFDLISASFLSPTLSAAAGLIVLVLAGSLFWSLRPGETVPVADVAATTPKAVEKTEATAAVPQIVAAGEDETAASVESPAPEQPRPVTADMPRRAVPRTRTAGSGTVMTARYIPGEESYINTIADLNTAVDGSKDNVLPPASRIAFERDMALVDDAIRRMRAVVAKDPNNRAARQVLYGAYQDKIDLLNSVGRRDELMASLQ
ncbi:MAG: zf-HC2 domain-containing protein [Acidobacteria bacterium]|nr:zf-HC2 domain-containing protein [Acidobacteriota bacterium]